MECYFFLRFDTLYLPKKKKKIENLFIKILSFCKVATRKELSSTQVSTQPRKKASFAKTWEA